jgi:hypothetical protein
MGSNKLIKNAIKKYGRKEFKKEILFIFDNEFEMYEKELELVNENFIARNDTYNIAVGGKGWSDIGNYVTKNKLGIHSLTFDERSTISKNTQKNRNKTERNEMCSNAGKKGSATAISNKRGIFGLSKEEKKINALKGNAAARKKGVGLFDKRVQSEMGKRGGAKNKGFMWYNDGNNDFKYTKKDQLLKDFEDFIFENSIFYKGRIKTFRKTRPDIKGKRSFVTNGIINKQINKSELKSFLENNNDYKLGKTHKSNIATRTGISFEELVGQQF